MSDSARVPRALPGRSCVGGEGRPWIARARMSWTDYFVAGPPLRRGWRSCRQALHDQRTERRVVAVVVMTARQRNHVHGWWLRPEAETVLFVGAVHTDQRHLACRDFRANRQGVV